jgi:hypothetical protein
MENMNTKETSTVEKKQIDVVESNNVKESSVSVSGGKLKKTRGGVSNNVNSIQQVQENQVPVQVNTNLTQPTEEVPDATTPIPQINGPTESETTESETTESETKELDGVNSVTSPLETQQTEEVPDVTNPIPQVNELNELNELNKQIQPETETTELTSALETQQSEDVPDTTNPITQIPDETMTTTTTTSTTPTAEELGINIPPEIQEISNEEVQNNQLTNELTNEEVQNTQLTNELTNEEVQNNELTNELKNEEILDNASEIPVVIPIENENGIQTAQQNNLLPVNVSESLNTVLNYLTNEITHQVTENINLNNNNDNQINIQDGYNAVNQASEIMATPNNEENNLEGGKMKRKKFKLTKKSRKSPKNK